MVLVIKGVGPEIDSLDQIAIAFRCSSAPSASRLASLYALPRPR